MLDAKGKMRLYVNVKQTAMAEGVFILETPNDGLDIGRDRGSAVGGYSSEMPFEGQMSNIRMYFGTPDEATIRAWADQ